MIDDGYKVLDHYWKKTDLNANAPVTTLNNDPEPSIMFLDWIHEDTEESLSEISYGSGASLKVQVNNPKGNEATISIEKEDGSDFENGKKKLTTTAFLDGNGFGKVSALNFLGEWASEDEELDFDNLIAYVEHAGLKKSSPKLKVKKPKVTFEWQKPSDNSRLEEVDYGERVNLAVEVTDGKQGTKVQVEIIKKDKTEFVSGTEEYVFEVELDANGKAIVKDILMEKDWIDYKQSDKDKLIAGAIINGTKSNTSETLVLIPLPEVIVDFRPANDYNGEFGFDYMRDTNKGDFVSYKDIMLAKVGDSLVSDKSKNEGKNYNNLKKYLGIIQLTDQRTDEEGNKIGNPSVWYKDKDGNPKEYIQSYLAIYEGDTADLSVQIETLAHENDLTIEYDTSLFSLNTTIIPKKESTERIDKHIQLTCLKEFGTEQYLRVKYKDRTLGQLNILPNDKAHRCEKKVVFVQVETNLTGLGRDKKKGSSRGQQAYLERYLKQGFIDVEIAPEPLEISVVGNADFNRTYTRKSKSSEKVYIKNIRWSDTIFKRLRNMLPKEYAEHIAVFFIDEVYIMKDGRSGNGEAADTPSNDVVIFRGHNDKTVTHEVMHAIGLPHSFSNESKFIFVEGQTQNIMDYSHLKGIDGISTWKWQWEILQKKCSE